MAEERKFCTFQLENEWFGVDVLQVQEVVGYAEVTPVPLAPSPIAGLMNLRGQILTVIDLRRCLGMPERKPYPLPMNLILSPSEAPVSFQVDQVGDVLSVDESTFERLPEPVSGRARELISGVYKLDGRLLHSLDAGQVIRLVDTEKKKHL